MVKAACVSFFDLKNVFFIPMFKLCCLISQNMVKYELKITIQNYQWASFKSKYELTNIESNTFKLYVPLGSSFRKDVTFIRIGIKTNHSFKRASSISN